MTAGNGAWHPTIFFCSAGGRKWPDPEATLAAGGVRCLGSTCRRSVGPNPPLVTRSRHRAEAFQIEAQAGPGSGIPPAKMSQRVSLNDGEGLLPSLCSDEPRAERTDQRVRQRSTHRVRDFVFARFAERPVFARPTSLVHDLH